MSKVKESLKEGDLAKLKVLELYLNERNMNLESCGPKGNVYLQHLPGLLVYWARLKRKKKQREDRWLRRVEYLIHAHRL